MQARLARLVLMGAAATLGLLAPAAQAAVVSLNFEGIAATYPFFDNPQILDFYNGGTSGVGTSGVNYGVVFGPNALAVCWNSQSVVCTNGSRGGEGDPDSSQSGLFFLEGANTYLNYAAGFTTAFSLNYVSLSRAGSVTVYDGLDGSGNILATLDLQPNAQGCPDYFAEFCPLQPIGATFTGTARSIGFGGVADAIGFDDITFGSERPGPPVPAPLALTGALAAFRCSRRLRRLASQRSDAPRG